MLDDKNFIFPSSMCGTYRKIRLGNRPFYNKAPTDQMPLGFTILTNDVVEQFERFLISIYHPNNMYCVHVDQKSSETFHRAVNSIVNCFDNVFMVTKRENVHWGSFALLKAQINCMTDLVNLTSLIENHPNLKGKRNVDWEYARNYFFVI